MKKTRTSGTKRRKSTTKARKAVGTKARKSAPKAGASPATKLFAGKRYTKKACSKTKTGAKATAKKLRDSGKNARIVKGGPGYCVYARG